MASKTKCESPRRLLRYATVLWASWLLWYTAPALPQSSWPVISEPVTPLDVKVDQSSLMSAALQDPTITVSEGGELPTAQPVPTTPTRDSVIQLQRGPGAREKTLSNPLINTPGLAVAV